MATQETPLVSPFNRISWVNEFLLRCMVGALECEEATLEIAFIVSGVGILGIVAFVFHKRFSEPPKTHEPANLQDIIGPDDADNLRHTNNPAPFS